MPHMTDRSCVAAQYADDRNLSIRMKLHAKHSTAQISMNDWLFAQYDLMGPCRILELGCGNAAQWEGRLDQLPNGSLLVLSDFSAGMAEIAWKKFESFSNVLVQQIDIQEIPFPDASFDKIIANHMLHHVPNLPQALKEVQRVLRPDGVFYATVIGEGGLQAYLHAAMKGFNPNLDMFGQNLPFSMQNGEEKLRRFLATCGSFHTKILWKLQKRRIWWIGSIPPLMWRVCPSTIWTAFMITLKRSVCARAQSAFQRK